MPNHFPPISVRDLKVSLPRVFRVERSDPNPKEMAFSKLKAHLRRIGARSFTMVFEALGDV